MREHLSLNGIAEWFVDSFGGMGSWGDQGYSKKDESRHGWIRTGVYIAAATIFVGQIIYGTVFSAVTAVIALAPAVAWAHLLASKGDMPVKLYPQPYRKRVSTNSGDRIIPSDPMLRDTPPLSVPFHRSVGEALGGVLAEDDT